MRVTSRSEQDAQRVSKRALLRREWYPAQINEAGESVSQKGNDYIALTLVVSAGDGDERTFRDVLTNTPLGAAKLRHACEAVGVLAKYEAGEISQDDFPGHDVQVKIGVEKKRGFPDRNVIEDYQAAASAVVDLRAAR